MPSPDKILIPWVDISDLPAPPHTVNVVTILLVSVCLLMLFLLARYLWQRPRLRALRQIHSISKHSSDTRQQLFLLHKTLQQGLQVNQLAHITFAPSHQDAWHRFCAELTQACYRPDTPDAHEVNRLATQARHWIKQA